METLKASDKCILSVKHFFHQQVSESSVDYLFQSNSGCVLWRPLLCCAATDGHVAIWDLNSFLLGDQHCPLSDTPCSPNPVIRFPVHQSGINDLDVQKFTPSSYLLATVGDDNALALTCLTVVDARTYQDLCPSVNVVWKLLEVAAHTSPITGSYHLNIHCGS